MKSNGVLLSRIFDERKCLPACHKGVPEQLKVALHDSVHVEVDCGDGAYEVVEVEARIHFDDRVIGSTPVAVGFHDDLAWIDQVEADEGSLRAPHGLAFLSHPELPFESGQRFLLHGDVKCDRHGSSGDCRRGASQQAFHLVQVRRKDHMHPVFLISRFLRTWCQGGLVLVDVRGLGHAQPWNKLYRGYFVPIVGRTDACVTRARSRRQQPDHDRTYR
mmetsp:Transcript_2349/g.4966  ORF Transcript_2349/g.4966 Transcript_2349/m.4966 type:complete len:218 (+) Transcript_2349:614-1267(+)